MEMNTYINPDETQRTLNIFSNVKAATVAVETTNKKEKDGEEEEKSDVDLAKVVFVDRCSSFECSVRSGDIEDEDLLPRQEEDRLRESSSCLLNTRQDLSLFRHSESLQ
jgi:hypothetical protein